MEETPTRNVGLNGWTTLNRAAKALGETRHTVLIRCVASELEAQVLAGQVLISAGSVERLLDQKRAGTAAA